MARRRRKGCIRNKCIIWCSWCCGHPAKCNNHRHSARHQKQFTHTQNYMSAEIPTLPKLRSRQQQSTNVVHQPLSGENEYSRSRQMTAKQTQPIHPRHTTPSGAINRTGTLNTRDYCTTMTHYDTLTCHFYFGTHNNSRHFLPKGNATAVAVCLKRADGSQEQATHAELYFRGGRKNDHTLKPYQKHRGNITAATRSPPLPPLLPQRPPATAGRETSGATSGRSYPTRL